MILSEKNKQDVIRPRKVIFGEEWFVSPENFGNDFFGVTIDGSRAQPFPTVKAAKAFARGEAKRRKKLGIPASIKVIDEDEKVLLDLSVS